MTLTPEQKRLYLRHVLLPEIGTEGQARLCAASFESRDDYAGAIESRYLSRAGLRGDDTLDRQRGSALEALRGAFAAVETIKKTLDVGRVGTFPEELFP